MTRINMTKYGFIRWPEEDFSDDGNRFTCYKVGTKVRVSKLVSGGRAYISARIDGNKLPYEEYSKLEHYKALDKLNGISIMAMTEQDLIDLYETCLSYEKEYTEAENTIKMPSLKEIREKCLELQEKRILELNKAEELVSKNIIILASKLSEYGWKELRQRLMSLKRSVGSYDPDKFANSLFNTRQSLDFCRPDSTYFKDSWDYEALVKTVRDLT